MDGQTAKTSDKWHKNNYECQNVSQQIINHQLPVFTFPFQLTSIFFNVAVVVVILIGVIVNSEEIYNFVIVVDKRKLSLTWSDNFALA